MASSTVFGLQTDPKKGKLSLQTLAQNALDPVTSDTYDPTLAGNNPWANLPLNLNTQAPAAATPQITAANIPANFQWTGTFDAANRGLQQQESDAGLKRAQTLQQIADTYLRGTQDAATTQDRSRNTLWASLADRGLVDSSPALKADTQLSTDYNRYLGNLSSARAADIANTEGSYASVLNQASRQREALAAQQQQAEQDRRLAEAQAQAETVRQQQEAAARQAEIQQLIASQEQARIAAEAAARSAAASSYSNSTPSTPSVGNSAPAPAATPAPSEDRVILPFNTATSNVPRSAVESWVKTYVDPNLAGGELNAVINALSKSGKVGLSRTTLSNVIAAAKAANSSPGFFY